MDKNLLEQKLTQTTDLAERVKLLRQLAAKTLATHPAESKSYANMLIDLSSKLQDQEQLCLGHILLSKSYTNMGNSAKESEHHVDLAIEIASKNKLYRQHAEALNTKGMIQMNQSALANAEATLNEAEYIIEHQCDRTDDDFWFLRLSNLYQRAQVIFRKDSDYTKVLSMGIEGLEAAIKHKTNRQDIIFLQLLALVTDKMEQYSESLNFIDRLIAIEKLSGSNLNLLGAHLFRASLLQKLNQQEQAEICLNEALVYAEIMNDAVSSCMIQQKKIDVATNQGKLEEAIQQCEALIAQASSLSLLKIIHETQLKKADIYVKQNQFGNAIKILIPLYNHYKSLNDQHELQRITGLLHVAYHHSNQDNEAYKYLLKNMVLTKSLVDEQKNKEYALLHTKYETKEKEIQLSKLKTLQLESELKAIRSQMNPHFIFNALNSIQEIIFLGDKRVAGKHLSNFGWLMRKILSASGQSTIPLEEEISILQKYLELEALRFEEKDFNYNINVDIDEEVMNLIQLPPMLIQPLVENAIKHGLLHKQTDRRLSIDINYTSTENLLRCVVTDNGIGRKAAVAISASKEKEHESFSTSANQKRLDLLNQNRSAKIGLHYIDLSPGTQAEIVIPITLNNNAS